MFQVILNPFNINLLQHYLDLAIKKVLKTEFFFKYYKVSANKIPWFINFNHYDRIMDWIVFTPINSIYNLYVYVNLQTF